ncbi:hypothetical protein [Phaeobacter inhibens]|uniref:hypothetical protein n=1 Tax=Phaeobacter inhibens TaxID=221822 RepID=UPI0021A34A27|nr:hypothetical protein [Phaeobacter inhibens]UWR49793.1 hypothetical protein K4F87_03315 [Phaeobacter inhibens]UWR61422.1 hypothetical protein K4F88_03525 [Phaeobacter inhibens]
MPHETCFVGKVLYKKEGDLETYVKNGGELQLQSNRFAESLLLKRRAFKHEREVRLVFFGKTELYDTKGLYRYGINPHSMITQIMADPNRDRNKWTSERLKLQAATGFRGRIKRSKIYDAPAWASPSYGTQKSPDAP